MKLKLYKILRPIIRREVVVLIDFSGHEEIRFAHYKKEVGLVSKRFGFGIHNVKLNEDNTVHQFFKKSDKNYVYARSYVTSWRWG